MTFGTYHLSEAWQEAVKLGKPLTLLTEELPAQEDHGLIMTIQGLMVDLPASIALDILSGTNNRRSTFLKLQSAIEIIDQVYPALDTMGVHTALIGLFDHCESDQFGKPKSQPAPPVNDEEPAVENDETSVAAAAGLTITDTSLVQSVPEPAPIAAPVAEPVPSPEPAPAPVTVAVSPDPASAQPRV